MKKRLALNIALIILSALLQAYLIQTIVKPSSLVPMGFTGLAVLTNMLLAKININVSISTLIIVYNLPVAVFCAKYISKKFTILSTTQIVLVSFFLRIFEFKPLSSNIFLDVVIGAFVYGFTTVFALKAEGSTGGTDFIALYVSEKRGKTIWEYVFVFNAIIIFIFGYNKGWESAGYSIIFQYIITITISKFYLRYARVTLQIISKKGEEIVEEYVKHIVHGITITKGTGGYSKEPVDILYTVVSTYETKDIIRMIKKIDENVIINVIKTEDFYGKFILSPM